MCIEFHTSTQILSDEFYLRLQRKNYVTPTSYLELIQTFRTLLSEKRVATLKAKNRYLTGLKQLDVAGQQVHEMQIKLEQLQPELKISADIVSKEIAKVQAATAITEEQREVVKVDEIAASKVAKVAGDFAEQCAEIMADAMPLIHQAEAALNTLTAPDITIVKRMTNPPFGVKLVMEAVCILKVSYRVSNFEN